MIGVCNIDNDMKSELSKFVEVRDLNDSSDFVELNGLAIDWVDKNSDNFVTQAAMVEHYARKSIPIVIYDRFMSVTPKEYSWLKKFNVSFLEPAFNNRTEFEYLPQWSKLEMIGPKSLKFDLGYIGDLNRKIRLFEKYYRETAVLWPESSISFYAKDFKETSKLDEWQKDGLYSEWDKEYNFRFTVLIDSPHNIEIGYLPNNLFEYMKYGTVPLCPIEQKYFQGMFFDLVISKASEVEYFIRNFKDLREVLIDDIFENIKGKYPEFTIEYACDKIKRKLMI